MAEKRKIIFFIPADKIDTMRNPGYSQGDNRTRSSFTWHLESKKGQVFQKVMKPAFIAMINKWHTWILKSWDPEGFVYDDPRLQYLDKNLHAFIDKYFDHEQRKLDFMHKAADIGLFYMKEDKYYCSRAFHFINQLPIFELVPSEVVNLKHNWKEHGTIDLKTLEKLENDPINVSMPDEVIV